MLLEDEFTSLSSVMQLKEMDCNILIQWGKQKGLLGVLTVG